jgi:hypothetical protein
MRSITTLLLGLVVAAWSAPAAAEVLVTFDHPETYTDAGLYSDRGSRAREPAMDGIRQHLERLGARYLRPGQTLKIEVLDIDLAGRFEPWRPFASDVRFMRAVTWPRIKVRYSLEESGAVRSSDTEMIVDQNYLSQVGGYFQSESLRYEKTMLDDWFRARFVDRRTARH